MKKILHTLSFSMLALLIFSCSSEEEFPEYTKMVIDRVIVHNYDAILENGTIKTSKLDEELNYVYSYDNNGKVSGIAVIGKTKIAQNGVGTTYNANTSFTYNSNNTLKEVSTKNISTSSFESIINYEYNGLNLVSKSVNLTTNETTIFEYNEKRQLIKSTTSNSPNNSIIAYTYDDRGNMTRAYDALSPKNFNMFTFDTKVTPYEHMNINYALAGIDKTSRLPITIKTPNNVKSIVINVENQKGTDIDLRYNTDDFVVKSTSYFSKNKQTLRSQYSYTYKTITAKR